LNAVDAMPQGGDLTIRARRGPAEGQKTPVYLEVSDTGVGMDETTRRRCLEPFFTTKGERGTGLGLAMVYGVAQRHGAKVEIDSSPGHGTTTRLVFPPRNPVEPMTEAPAPPPPNQHLRILIVDDDPLLIQSLRDTLSADGHEVVTAGGGQEGITRFEAEPMTPGFSVVITDLGMPYVDGRKVAATIKSASPATPVILLTGWGERLVAEGEIPENVDIVLSKPPKLRNLRAAFAELAVREKAFVEPEKVSDKK
jgi:CheY-like chemotaxis protein